MPAHLSFVDLMCSLLLMLYFPHGVDIVARTLLRTSQSNANESDDVIARQLSGLREIEDNKTATASDTPVQNEPSFAASNTVVDVTVVFGLWHDSHP